MSRFIPIIGPGAGGDYPESESLNLPIPAQTGNNSGYWVPPTNDGGLLPGAFNARLTWDFDITANYGAYNITRYISYYDLQNSGNIQNGIVPYEDSTFSDSIDMLWQPMYCLANDDDVVDGRSKTIFMFDGLYPTATIDYLEETNSLIHPFLYTLNSIYGFTIPLTVSSTGASTPLNYPGYNHPMHTKSALINFKSCAFPTDAGTAIDFTSVITMSDPDMHYSQTISGLTADTYQWYMLGTADATPFGGAIEGYYGPYDDSTSIELDDFGIISAVFTCKIKIKAQPTGPIFFVTAYYDGTELHHYFYVVTFNSDGTYPAFNENGVWYPVGADPLPDGDYDDTVSVIAAQPLEDTSATEVGYYLYTLNSTTFIAQEESITLNGDHTIVLHTSAEYLILKIGSTYVVYPETTPAITHFDFYSYSGKLYATLDDIYPLLESGQSPTIIGILVQTPITVNAVNLSIDYFEISTAQTITQYIPPGISRFGGNLLQWFPAGLTKFIQKGILNVSTVAISAAQIAAPETYVANPTSPLLTMGIFDSNEIMTGDPLVNTTYDLSDITYGAGYLSAAESPVVPAPVTQPPYNYLMIRKTTTGSYALFNVEHDVPEVATLSPITMENDILYNDDTAIGLVGRNNDWRYLFENIYDSHDVTLVDTGSEDVVIYKFTTSTVNFYIFTSETTFETVVITFSITTTPLEFVDRPVYCLANDTLKFDLKKLIVRAPAEIAVSYLYIFTSGYDFILTIYITGDFTPNTIDVNAIQADLSATLGGFLLFPIDVDTIEITVLDSGTYDDTNTLFTYRVHIPEFADAFANRAAYITAIANLNTYFGGFGDWNLGLLDNIYTYVSGIGAFSVVSGPYEPFAMAGIIFKTAEINTILTGEFSDGGEYIAEVTTAGILAITADNLDVTYIADCLLSFTIGEAALVYNVDFNMYIVGSDSINTIYLPDNIALPIMSDWTHLIINGKIVYPEDLAENITVEGVTLQLGDRRIQNRAYETAITNIETILAAQIPPDQTAFNTYMVAADLDAIAAATPPYAGTELELAISAMGSEAYQAYIQAAEYSVSETTPVVHWTPLEQVWLSKIAAYTRESLTQPVPPTFNIPNETALGLSHIQDNLNIFVFGPTNPSDSTVYSGKNIIYYNLQKISIPKNVTLYMYNISSPAAGDSDTFLPSFVVQNLPNTSYLHFSLINGENLGTTVTMSTFGTVLLVYDETGQTTGRLTIASSAGVVGAWGSIVLTIASTQINLSLITVNATIYADAVYIFLEVTGSLEPDADTGLIPYATVIPNIPFSYIIQRIKTLTASANILIQGFNKNILKISSDAAGYEQIYIGAKNLDNDNYHLVPTNIYSYSVDETQYVIAAVQDGASNWFKILQPNVVNRGSLVETTSVYLDTSGNGNTALLTMTAGTGVFSFTMTEGTITLDLFMFVTATNGVHKNIAFYVPIQMENVYIYEKIGTVTNDLADYMTTVISPMPALTLGESPFGTPVLRSGTQTITFNGTTFQTVAAVNSVYTIPFTYTQTGRSITTYSALIQTDSANVRTFTANIINIYFASPTATFSSSKIFVVVNVPTSFLIPATPIVTFDLDGESIIIERSYVLTSITVAGGYSSQITVTDNIYATFTRVGVYTAPLSFVYEDSEPGLWTGITMSTVPNVVCLDKYTGNIYESTDLPEEEVYTIDVSAAYIALDQVELASEDDLTDISLLVTDDTTNWTITLPDAEPYFITAFNAVKLLDTVYYIYKMMFYRLKYVPGYTATTRNTITLPVSTENSGILVETVANESSYVPVAVLYAIQYGTPIVIDSIVDVSSSTTSKSLKITTVNYTSGDTLSVSEAPTNLAPKMMMFYELTPNRQDPEEEHVSGQVLVTFDIVGTTYPITILLNYYVHDPVIFIYKTASTIQAITSGEPASAVVFGFYTLNTNGTLTATSNITVGGTLRWTGSTDGKLHMLEIVVITAKKEIDVDLTVGVETSCVLGFDVKMNVDFTVTIGGDTFVYDGDTSTLVITANSPTTLEPRSSFIERLQTNVKLTASVANINKTIRVYTIINESVANLVSLYGYDDNVILYIDGVLTAVVAGSVDTDAISLVFDTTLITLELKLAQYIQCVIKYGNGMFLTIYVIPIVGNILVGKPNTTGQIDLIRPYAQTLQDGTPMELTIPKNATLLKLFVDGDEITTNNTADLYHDGEILYYENLDYGVYPLILKYNYNISPVWTVYDGDPPETTYSGNDYIYNGTLAIVAADYICDVRTSALWGDEAYSVYHKLVVYNIEYGLVSPDNTLFTINTLGDPNLLVFKTVDNVFDGFEDIDTYFMKMVIITNNETVYNFVNKTITVVATSEAYDIIDVVYLDPANSHIKHKQIHIAINYEYPDDTILSLSGETSINFIIALSLGSVEIQAYTVDDEYCEPDVESTGTGYTITLASTSTASDVVITGTKTLVLYYMFTGNGYLSTITVTLSP